MITVKWFPTYWNLLKTKKNEFFIKVKLCFRHKHQVKKKVTMSISIINQHLFNTYFGELSLDDIFNIGIKGINKNVKTKYDETSLKFLSKKKLEQGQCIILGNTLEKIFSNVVENTTTLENIKQKNKKGEKEKDHLFIDYEKKEVYYSEIKSNINLDTEKSKATYEKCQDIVKELENNYEGYKVIWCLTSLRYLYNHDIPLNLKKKYKNISENLFGLNEYLKMVGSKFIFKDMDDYKNFIDKTVEYIF